MFLSTKYSSGVNPEGYVFKLFPLFLALFVVIQIECIIFVNKQISIFHLTTTLSGITFPINLLILAIITHCYGKQCARQVIWINTFIVLQFVAYSYFANSLEWATTSSNQEFIQIFDQLVPALIRSGLAAIFAENVAEFIFIMLYNQYKNDTISSPRYTMRPKTDQFIALFKHCLIANFIMLMFSYLFIFPDESFYDVLILVLQILVLKSFIEIIFSPLAILLIAKVKKFEGFDVHDISGNNPFLFLMNFEELNFNQVSNDENSTAV